MHLATVGLRMSAFGSRPCAMASRSSNRRLRIITIPRSLGPMFSLVRSAMRPWPTQATMSWLITWLVIQRPCSSLIGLTQLRHAFLHVGLAPLRHPHEEPGDAERVLVVHWHAPFEMIAEVEAVRPERDPAHGPIRILLVGILPHPLVDESVVEFLELELEVLAGVRARIAGEPQTPVVVHPLEVHGVAGVFLALEPVAGNLGEHDFAKAVLPREWLPYRQLGNRLRPHIGPQQACAFLHRISGGRAALLRPRAGIDEIVIGLLDAAPAFVHEPAVVVAADAGRFDKAVGEIRASMRAVAVEQPETSALVLIEHEILAHQPNGLDRVLVEFARAADGHPIAAQQLSHRSPRSDLGEKAVFLGAQHADLSPILAQSPPVYWNFGRPQCRMMSGEDLTPLSPGRPRGNPSRIRALAPAAAHSTRSARRAPPPAARSRRRETDRGRARCRPASPWNPPSQDRTLRGGAPARTGRSAPFPAWPL